MRNKSRVRPSPADWLGEGGGLVMVGQLGLLKKFVQKLTEYQYTTQQLGIHVSGVPVDSCVV